MKFNQYDPDNRQLIFPPIETKNKLKLPTPRQIAQSPIVREFLMKNWEEQRLNSNKMKPNP